MQQQQGGIARSIGALAQTLRSVRPRHLGFAFFWLWMSMFMHGPQIVGWTERASAIATGEFSFLPLLALTLFSAVVMLTVALFAGSRSLVGSRAVCVGAVALTVAGTVARALSGGASLAGWEAGPLAVSTAAAGVAGIGTALTMVGWGEYYGCVGARRASVYIVLSVLFSHALCLVMNALAPLAQMVAMSPVKFGTTTRGKERPCFPTIVVNKYGQRFANEDWHSDSVGTLAQGQEDGFVFQIFDSVAYEAVAEDKRATLACADTVAGLAEQLGINPAGLEQTIAYWNEHAAQGEDPLFGKVGGTVAPLEPPFYGIQVWSYAIVAHFGGLRVDERCQVLRPTGEPIARLFAGGIDAGGWMGRQYPGSGTAVGGTYSMSRIAARELAKLEVWDA